MSDNQTLAPTVLTAFRNGDHAAFREVFNTFYNPLFYFINKLIDNDQEAEDIAVNTFHKLFKRSAAFETHANIKAFLFITARNNSFDYLRFRKVYKEKQQSYIEAMKDDTMFQYEYNIDDDLIEKVLAAIEKLPNECKRIFKMLYFEELTPAEVAEILQISVSTVYNHKSHALKVLRISLPDRPLALALIFLATYMRDIFSLSGSSRFF
jgi:RNA polymerase sigma-70 factor (family 1)